VGLKGGEVYTGGRQKKKYRPPLGGEKATSVVDGGWGVRKEPRRGRKWREEKTGWVKRRVGKEGGGRGGGRKGRKSVNRV